jgi:DNA repair exonuclease SbcCD ATPase subunit
MKITRITIHNFLKLKDVDFNPSHTNVIVGKNKQGKTSILKAIRTAFTGDADDTSIRIGEGKAEITLELDTLNVKRTITEKGNYLDISNKEGMKMPAPQKYLDGILGTFSFNPIEFFDKKPADRKKYLLNAIKMTITPDELVEYTGEKLAGIDFDKHALEVLEDVRKYYYEKRTIANAEVSKKEKSLQALVESIPQDFDPSKVNSEAIQAMRDAIQKDEMERVKAEAHVQQIQEWQTREAQLELELKELQKKIVEALDVKFDYSDDVTITAAKETLAKLEAQSEHLFSHKRAEEVRSELTTALGEADRLDTVVKAVTKRAPEELIKKAKLPVDGLTIDGDDILINGVSIDNLSASEQLKFGLEIVRALNGEFKVVCIDGVELLDKESFEFFLKEIEDDEYQYFVSRVDGDTPHSIVVEDGEIKTN